MAGVFPAERNYRFSSSLMNLKFMQKTAGDTIISSIQSKHCVSGPALTILEASRREMEARQQLPGAITIEEGYSVSRLFDLVVGRFSFGGINPILEVTLNCDNANPEGAESENTKTEGQDVTDAEMLDRYSSVVNTMADKYTGRGRKGMKRQSEHMDWPSKKPLTGDQVDLNSRAESKLNKHQHGRYFTMYNNADRGRHDRNSKETSSRSRRCAAD